MRYHEPSGKGRRHIPDVHDRDRLGIALTRAAARCELPNESRKIDQLPVRRRVGVFQPRAALSTRRGTARSRRAPSASAPIVDRQLRHPSRSRTRGRRPAIVPLVRQRSASGRDGKGGLPGVHAAKRRVGRVHGPSYSVSAKRSAHRRGQRRLPRLRRRFLPPVRVGACSSMSR